jgi:rhamnogalacturonan endolyase
MQRPLIPFLLTLALLPLTTFAQSSPAGPVTVAEDATHFTLSNGTITAKVLKRNGDLTSLQLNGVETLTDKSGHAGAYWSHDASGGTQLLTRITIDPKTNNGQRAEVSVKGISGGKKMGRPAGGAPDGDFPADIDIRYSLGQGDSGVYTYCTLEHLPEYPAGSIGESRFCAKLAAMYDWLHVDKNRDKYYPREEEGEDKYVYTAVQSENLAYGWSSTKEKTGWFLVNPTFEYLSGGPTKVEFLCHRDTTQVQAPCVLNYWRSSHYGGAVVTVKEGEHWAKTIGPYLLYVNKGADPAAMLSDAKEQQKKEAGKWPYDWVKATAYANKGERSTVTGTFALKDPLMPGGAKFTGNLMVGLAGPEYTIARPVPPNAPPGAAAGTRTITWQTDAKHYQFWSKNTGNGSATAPFTIPNVSPGSYTLYAYADGVLGDFAKASITIPAGGKPVDLGTIDWTPVRRGKEVWQIGLANRTATEFAGGDKYFEPDTQIQYAKKFPDDVTFTVGKSDVSKDWYFEHIPHNVDPNARVVPFSGIRSEPGKATPYRIVFDLPGTPKGRATLRLALCTASAPTLNVTVNDKPAGNLDRLNVHGDSTITRHNIQGIWFERELAFDASLLKPGQNTLTLTVPGGSLNAGIIYDCVRLELDENAQAPQPQ